LADNVLGVKHSSGIGEHGRIEDAEGYTTTQRESTTHGPRMRDRRDRAS